MASGKNIYGISLRDIVPSSIASDPQIQAIIKALDPELQSVSQDTREALIYSRIDELPEKVIDLLAWQFHVDFYEPTGMDLETKRDLVKTSILVHRHKGTKWAIREALRMIDVDAEIKAWHELGWETPYTFHVRASVGEKIGVFSEKEVARLVRNVIEETKSARDWLAVLELGILLDDVVYSNNTDILDTAHITPVLGFHDAYTLPGRIVGRGCAGTRRYVGNSTSGCGKVGEYLGAVRAGNGVEDFGPLALTVSGFDDRVRGAIQRAGYSSIGPVGSGDIVGPSASVLDGGARMTVVRVPRIGSHNRIHNGISAGSAVTGIGKIGEGRLRIGYRNYQTVV